jgi:hypothetical protein
VPDLRPRPNLFVAGVAKAGTTSLHSLLARHPQIFMSTPKEPHFLAGIDAAPEAAYTLNAIRDEDAYLGLFAEASEPIVGESSTSYWWREETADRIDSFSPGAHAVIVLRDPVQRAYSHYLNDVRDSIEDRPFIETLVPDRPGESALRWGDPAIRIELGFYADRLQHYLDVFRERLLVLLFEDFIADPNRSLSEIFAFLGVTETLPAEDRAPGAAEAQGNPHRMPKGRLSRGLLRSRLVRRIGRRVLPPHLRSRAYESLFAQTEKPAIDGRAVASLTDLYAADSARVERILGRTLPWPTNAPATPVREERYAQNE